MSSEIPSGDGRTRQEGLEPGHRRAGLGSRGSGLGNAARAADAGSTARPATWDPCRAPESYPRRGPPAPSRPRRARARRARRRAPRRSRRQRSASRARPPGRRPRPRLRNDLREGPTRTGRPRAASVPTPANAAALCSARLAKPRPGSTTIWSHGTPRLTRPLHGAGEVAGHVGGDVVVAGVRVHVGGPSAHVHQHERRAARRGDVADARVELQTADVVEEADALVEAEAGHLRLGRVERQRHADAVELAEHRHQAGAFLRGR